MNNTEKRKAKPNLAWRRVLRGCLMVAAAVMLLTCCSRAGEKHFISDPQYRAQVDSLCDARRKEFPAREQQLFALLDADSLSLRQKEALKFLYAYAPLSDIADYDGEFFLRQINTAFEAERTFGWDVPEDVFRHFVLPYRVNNEDLDEARQVFFEELKPRIQGLKMKEAALEINHWCHEKVTYRGTDVRTSAPLALIRTSWGRCGEESTLAVTAFRSVGIPARQCYTPRWVHTDDNHAWVEVYVEGQWHFLGACEPEPDLDIAWFSAPAKRTMLVHTNVFGSYAGAEERLLADTRYARINLLSNYAPTRRVSVKVEDSNGNAVKDAKVAFKVYNYAELYPLATLMTDANGLASMQTGLGDLVVWAAKDEAFAYAKAAGKADTTLTLKLTRRALEEYSESYELVPPAEQSIPTLSQEQQAANRKRFLEEDSIRNAYMNTFITEAESREFARGLKLDEEAVAFYLQHAQGNYKAIQDFMTKNADNPYLLQFFTTLTAKDLRDTPESYLSHHLAAATQKLSLRIARAEKALRYIMSPRIGRALIRPWREKLAEIFADSIFSPEEAARWTEENIRISTTENYYDCPISPLGVYELRTADKESRAVFFVALCRSLGFAARIDAATGTPQYLTPDNIWHDVDFEKVEQTSIPQAKLTLKASPKNPVKPQYYHHFTLAKFKDGDFQTLDYENNPSVKDFPMSLSLDSGYYRLMLGSRAHDGSVTVAVDYFNLMPNATVEREIALPIPQGKRQVLGIIDMNTNVSLNNGDTKSLKELSNGGGLMLAFLNPNQEPSRHILQDMGSVSQEFEESPCGIVFIAPDDIAKDGISLSPELKLPGKTALVRDGERGLLNTVIRTLQLQFNDNFPLVLYLNRNGGILYYSTGYKIGIPAAILMEVRKPE